jgi:lipoprotein-releasing system permease protein
MNSLSLFLAQRLLLTDVYHKGVSTMTYLCFAGIFIGTCALLLITAIMHGFEKAIHEKMQGIHAHITIDAGHNGVRFKHLKAILSKEIPEIASIAPHTYRHVLGKIDNVDMPTVIMLNAIDPTAEVTTTSIAQKIQTPQAVSFVDLFADNAVIIGKQNARTHNINIGDTIEILFIPDDKIHNRTATFDAYTATVSGIFDTGIDEFDQNVMYCSFTLLKNLFPQCGVEQVAIKLHPHADERKVIEKISQRTGLTVYSWKDLYPALVAALHLETYVSFFVIMIIIIVASMNNFSLLYMNIAHHRHDIALLKALGMPNRAIRRVFFIMGMSISLIAMLCGIIVASIIAFFIKQYPCITLPDSYYVTYLPIALEWYIIAAVIVIVLFVSLIATWIPTHPIKSINISQVLRFEG